MIDLCSLCSVHLTDVCQSCKNFGSFIPDVSLPSTGVVSMRQAKEMTTNEFRAIVLHGYQRALYLAEHLAERAGIE